MAVFGSTWKLGTAAPALLALGVACGDPSARQDDGEDEADAGARLAANTGAPNSDPGSDEISEPLTSLDRAPSTMTHEPLDSFRGDGVGAGQDAGVELADDSTRAVGASENAQGTSTNADLTHLDAGSVDAGAVDHSPMIVEGAKNVIVLIADGYGATSIDATRMFINGNTAPLNFETLPHSAWVSTHNARNEVTDSAASATAMATGFKTFDSVVSVASPGDGSRYKTALEIQKARGKRTAIVSANTNITDATPACFAAHSPYRGDSAVIANSYFTDTRPNAIFGLVDTGITPSAAYAAGYTVVQNAEQLAALDLDVEHHVSGQFTPQTVPPLKDMALAALDILEDSPDGFFALIEQEETDTANHGNNLPQMVAGAVEFHDTVAAVMAWAEGRDDTLIVVGTDHETGGLTVSETNPTAGSIPSHSYSTWGHTNADVRFFAGGVGAAELAGNLDNTDLFALLSGYSATRCTRGSPCNKATTDIVLRESQPDTAYASGATLQADLDDGGGFEVQSLLAFGDLAAQLPTNCTFQAAKLVLHGSSESAHGIRLHRMLTAWSAASTWNSFGGDGIQTDDVEAAAEVSAKSDGFIAGINSFDVTATVGAWLADPSTNHGWVVLARGSDNADFSASEGNPVPELRLYCE